MITKYPGLLLTGALALFGFACTSVNGVGSQEESGGGGSGESSTGGSDQSGGSQAEKSSGGGGLGGNGKTGGTAGKGGRSDSEKGGAQGTGGNASAGHGTGGKTGRGGDAGKGGRLAGGGAGSPGVTGGAGGVSTKDGGVGKGGAGRAGGAGEAGGAGQAGGTGGAGGSVAPGGDGGGATCPLPTTFKWKSGAPIAQPKSGWVSLKDFTNVVHNNKHIIYMTTHDQSAYGAAMMMFDDWPDAASATQTKLSFNAVAPTLLYFTPKKLWVLAYQWGRTKFSYRTSTDPTNAGSWGAEQSLYNTALPTGGTGPIDQTLICNSTKCYLYYAGDNGHIYKSSMPIGNFPSEFAGAVDSGIQGTTQNLFEAVEIYTVKGSNKYLMIVEAQGNGRYFRAWTATDLDGPWTLLTDAFASKSNVTFTSSWTNDISHGDLVRDPDETKTIDPCNLQMVFQGRDPNSTASYDMLPYRPGMLTLQR